jgi:hypothetical protein
MTARLETCFSVYLVMISYKSLSFLPNIKVILYLLSTSLRAELLNRSCQEVKLDAKKKKLYTAQPSPVNHNDSR